MASIEASSLPIERRRARPAVVLVIAVVGLFVLLISGLGVGLLMSAQRVRAELAKIRTAGEPVTPGDLEAFYALPPGSRDTTALWLDAIEIASQPVYLADAKGLPLVDDANQRPPELDEPWPDQAEVEKFLDKYSDLLAKLHEAAVLGGDARFPTRFADGASLKLEWLTGLRSLARLLTLESHVHLRHGDTHAGADSIHAILALANSLREEPMLVSLLVRAALVDLAIHRLQQLLAVADMQDSDLKHIDTNLAAIDYYAHLHRAMQGARVLDLLAFDDPSTLGKMAPHAPVFGLFHDADRAVFLQLMREVVAASAARTQLSLEMDMARAREQVQRALSSPTSKWRYPFSKALLDSTAVYSDAVGKATALRDVARTAMAIQRFRRAKGHLPASLDELVPDILDDLPIDPFNGGSLRWIVTDDDFCVYSVGPDGIDQDGAAPEHAFGGDVGFRVPHRKTSTKSPAE